MTDMREPIRRRKLSQEVMDRLLQRITGGEWAPGDSLPSERQLMDDYGVGRPAIREALQGLERLGIIQITQGERARVADPSFDSMLEQIGLTTRYILQSNATSLEELKQGRQLFEVQMARLAAEQADPAAIGLIRRRQAELRAALENLADFQRRDMLFHQAIAEASGNRLFAALSEAMLGWLGAFYRQLVRLEGAEQVTLGEHEEILEAIAAGNPDAAADAMARHLDRASVLYRQFEG